MQDCGSVPHYSTMDVLKLRIMTYDSKFQYGTNVGKTVRHIFNCDGGKKKYNKYFLIWTYYHMSKISFVDEILDDLGISIRIDKPGCVSEEQYKIIFKKLYPKVGPGNAFAIPKLEKVALDYRDRPNDVRYNQGHRKSKGKTPVWIYD